MPLLQEAVTKEEWILGEQKQTGFVTIVKGLAIAVISALKLLDIRIGTRGLRTMLGQRGMLELQHIWSIPISLMILLLITLLAYKKAQILVQPLPFHLLGRLIPGWSRL